MESTMRKTTLLTLTLGLSALALSTTPQADTRVTLGDQQRVSRLFAYPNNCSAICFRDWTLEQTVEHYLKQSVARDGYTQATVRVGRDNGTLYADITDVPSTYGEPLTRLLDNGELAYQGASQLNRDGKWAYNWLLFLPLGMALENRRSIELLHFPPDYSLTQAQDYLRSNTTDRWAYLLSVNGVPVDNTPAFQTIVDIAPIAAPASAGKALEGVYGYFNDYQTSMVKAVTRNAKGDSLPMVAFGSPVRTWVEQTYGQRVNVLGLVNISPTTGQRVPVLGSNHPSAIWYTADKANHAGDQDQADAAGLKMMGQDLSAACWQAGMGSNPKADAEATLNACTQKWQVTAKTQTCELFYRSIREMTPEQAAAKCNTDAVRRSLQTLQQPLEEI